MSELHREVLVDTATNKVSSLGYGDLEAWCSEQPGRSKPAYASSDDADLLGLGRKIGVDTGCLCHPHELGDR